jgi:NAD(P)-dependent dehydrogenase (short-subunit alcohol dehydrogenase family)
MKTPVELAAPAIVVTGVSTGIGNGIARQLVKAGYHVFGSVRKRQDAARLSNEFGSDYTPLIFDVTDERAVNRAAAQVKKALGTQKLSGLVNNAGVAVPGPLLELPVSEFRRQIEVNLVSVLAVTQAFFPLLRKASDDGARPARIVNISSVAGQFALPFLGPYAASKHGVEGLSDSLRRECMVTGVDVVVVDPGSVATPIWDKAGELDLSIYSHSPYLLPMTRMRDGMVAEGKRGLQPDRIGKLVVRILEARRPRARYVVGSGKVMVWMSRHFLSVRFVDRIIAKNLGLNVRRDGDGARAGR